VLAGVLRLSGRFDSRALVDELSEKTVWWSNFWLKDRSRMPSPLELGFDAAMLQIYDDASAACNGYRPTRFKQLVIDKGGLEAARSLLRGQTPASGFTELFLCGRLDLSLEALILKAPWNQLFSQAELAEARRRLSEVNYPP
jgi:hypothetical protein